MSDQNDFSAEQKRYLEGFFSGSGLAQSLVGAGAAPQSAKDQPVAPEGPDAAQLEAQNRTLAQGGKLVAEEKAKREDNPLDIYGRMKQAAREGVYPKGVDVFRWKYHGLFYVAPAQDSFMCRLRIPNGILSHWQFRGVADLAETYGGGFSHVTTRANLQVREIGAEHGPAFLEGLIALGLTAKGSGADNIRNVTGSPTAGIDPDEIYDTRAAARDWHHHILNDRALYGLPRKFNVAFDGGGRIAVLEETNDIGFHAVQVLEGAEVPAGIYFRLLLGGITGHGDFARDTGVILKPEEASEVAAAIVRVYIANGDRTNRNKARLKYLLDDWGFARFIEAVEQELGHPLARLGSEGVAPRRPADRLGHLGVHRQAQDGLHYIGVVLPVGRLEVAQMRDLADIAGDLGDGDLRLTVWQNLVISGIPEAKLAEAKARIEACGLDWRATSIRAGLVACTGNTGCRFAASNTKAHAETIARHCETRVELDTPVNIHLTGCHHSCAQHYIGDIGLLACRVSLDEESDDTEEGYHIYVGGGFGSEATMAREIFRDVTAEQAPATVERLLKAYLNHRESLEESFWRFAQRLDVESLRTLSEGVA